MYVLIFKSLNNKLENWLS